MSIRVEDNGAATARPPWWVSGDLNAAFGLGFNVLVNVLVLASLCVGVVQIPKADVFGIILPALGIQLLIGNGYYAFLARRLARRENRTDVCAMPYGPSVPHMFIVTFVIMLPTYLATKDPIRAWEAGLAWSFIIGLIVLTGAFVGPYIRRFTPRAALLGTLAGISIAFISMRPAAQMWQALWIALPVFAIIVIGFFTGRKLPGNIPIGLAALLVGTAIGWIGGYMSAPDVVTAAKDVAIGLPTFNISLLLKGLSAVAPLLATAIPLGIYNFCEGMTNVESAAVAGDNYNLRSVLLADGTGAVVGAALGSPFPPAVYIGHPGWKEAGGRTTYSLASGVVAGMVLGAIVAFMIDKRYHWAAGYCAAGAVLSFIGLIHGEQVGWAASPGVALGYLLAAVVCLAFSLNSTLAPAEMPDEHAPAGPEMPERVEFPQVAVEPTR
jgi:adenine/guanine/hypoxanthine permease